MVQNNFFLIVSSHKYGKSYWNGVSFGCKRKSIRYNSRKLAKDAIIKEVKPFILQLMRLKVNFQNYGVPYAEEE